MRRGSSMLSPDDADPKGSAYNADPKGSAHNADPKGSVYNADPKGSAYSYRVRNDWIIGVWRASSNRKQSWPYGASIT